MMKLPEILGTQPHAYAELRGSPSYPSVHGTVRFYRILLPDSGEHTHKGVLVAAEFFGLPVGASCALPVFAFHIHDGESCSGTPQDAFANAGTHYNPGNCPHPSHAGDMPPVFGCHGYGLLIFATDRFTLQEIVGKTVILHAGLDDFSTQPGGNAGEKMACGEIRRAYA